jgi:hypothetical protein
MAALAPSSPEYMQHRGLLVPTVMYEGMLKAQKEEDQKKRGQFFSEYVRYSMGNRPGIPSKPWSTPSFGFLRLCARESVIDRALIDARITQVKRVARPCWVPGKQIGYRVVHRRHADATFDMTDNIRDRCELAMNMLENALDRVIHPTIRNFLAICVEEELVIDRKAMVIFKDRRGRPEKFHLLDGSTIKPRLQVLAPYMLRTGETDIDRAAERMSAKLWEKGFDVDLTTAAWVQEINNRIVAAWTDDEMAVDVTNDTIELDKLFYGRSVLEKSLRLTGTFQNIWRYNEELFRTNTPEGLIFLFGDYDPVGLESFKKQMLSEQSLGGLQRIPIVAAGPTNEGIDGKYVKLKDTPKDALFTELLMQTAALKCAEYRAHPSIINIGTTGQANSIVFSVNEEAAIGLSQEEGFHGLLDSFSSWLTEALIKPFDSELVLVWEGLERDPLEKRVEIRSKELQYHTLNEVRAKEDLPPLPTELPTNPGDMVLSSEYENAYQMAAQMQAQASGELDAAGQPVQPAQNSPGASGGQGAQQKPQAYNADEEPLPPPVRGGSGQ